MIERGERTRVKKETGNRDTVESQTQNTIKTQTHKPTNPDQKQKQARKTSDHTQASDFLGVAVFFSAAVVRFLGGARFVVVVAVVGLAVVLVTRPDFVVLITLGTSTIAGAYIPMLDHIIRIVCDAEWRTYSGRGLAWLGDIGLGLV